LKKRIWNLYQKIMKHEINALATIAFRDWLKLLRDKTRIFASFIFPFIFIGVLGSSLQANLSSDVGYNFLTFVFAGVIGQTFFQSTASGIISLIEDRENDFSQEMFVSPISRYTIIFGKILGETLVAFTQGIAIIVFGLIIGVPISIAQMIRLFPAVFFVCILGGSFGLLVMTNLSSQRTANQIFPFLIFPQFFLSGVFSPIKNLPLPLFLLSRISPMTYAVDLVRNMYYLGLPEYNKVVLYPATINVLVITLLIIIFSGFGTYLFVRNERNK